MPFLHWFKRKSPSAKDEAETVLADQQATEPAKTPETLGASPEETSGQSTRRDSPLSADRPVRSQNPADASDASGQIDAAPGTPHLSVPIGAFYAKLPTDLLAPKTPDLTQLVQIAEEDVLLDQEAEEVTLPLSILSLSCPEIFIRAVDREDDLPITFSIRPASEFESAPSQEIGWPEEEEERLAPVTDVHVAAVEPASEQEIKLRLQPILTDLPPQLEPPDIQSLIATQAEISLRLDLIQSQLVHGRVVISAETFRKALPADLQHYFKAIDPTAEIPLPLQEIFSRLPPTAIRLREDQELDRPEEAISTPFGGHADEDAKRFSQAGVGTDAPAGELLQAGELPPSTDKPLKVTVESDSKRLQAIFTTDEPLNLAGTIQMVAELPGLKSCILITTDGTRLAGNFDDPSQEKPISSSLPELFHWVESRLKGLHAGSLETITLSYGLQQVSTFVQGRLCLIVFHDGRPFKPGVREKIQTVIKELVALSESEKLL
jgi:hypothetical protein